MGHLSLADTVLISQDIADQSSGSNVNGTALDMQGWDGCLFAFNIGAMAGGATFDARIVSSANANMSGATNIANAAITQVANTGNTTLVLVDIFRPTDRYIRSATIPATANTTFGSVAIRYRRSGILPPTQSASQVVKVAQN
jgi:hypothetical protein